MAPREKSSTKPGPDLWQSPEVRNAISSLPRLISIWPSELSDIAGAGRNRLLAKLRKALRAERQRGIAGHWTYDLARHAELLAVYRAIVTAQCRGRLSQAPADVTKPLRNWPPAPAGRKQNGPAL